MLAWPIFFINAIQTHHISQPKPYRPFVGGAKNELMKKKWIFHFITFFKK